MSGAVEELTAQERAELVAEWTRRLDHFCRALELVDFTVDRPDALTVRITAPRSPE